MIIANLPLALTLIAVAATAATVFVCNVKIENTDIDQVDVEVVDRRKAKPSAPSLFDAINEESRRQVKIALYRKY